MPSDTATSTPTVNPFNASASPMRQRDEDAEHDRRAALQRRARCDARTDTWTTTIAVSDASTGSDTPVITSATHHARPAANPDLATTPSSVEVGGVHDTA